MADGRKISLGGRGDVRLAGRDPKAVAGEKKGTNRGPAIQPHAVRSSSALVLCRRIRALPD
jgi:hypothetical protein